MSTSKSATVSFELPAKEAIVARPALRACCCGGAARGNFGASAAATARRGSVRGARRLGPPARRRGARNSAQRHSQCSLRTASARPQSRASRGLPYRSGLTNVVWRRRCALLSRTTGTKVCPSHRLPSVLHAASCAPVLALASPHRRALQRPRSGSTEASGDQRWGSFVRPTTLAAAKRCPTMDT